LQAADKIAKLRVRADDAGVPVIYVNDNYGQWNSDFRDTIERVMRTPGRAIAERLLPREGDLFVLKPRNSGFYCTPLELLLADMHVTTLVMTGFAGNICVLYTAHDARMRGYDVIVASDCIASERAEVNRHALEQMQRFLKVRVLASEEIDLHGLGQAS
jgi:nicotinamidase-related amidase